MKRNNPFWISYLSIVAVCFVVISCVFFIVGQINYKAEQKRFHQQKAEVIMNEFENQLKLMEDISLRIATNYEFQPFYFKGKIDRELSMLETLVQYQYASILTDDYFLYYGDSYVYRSANSTLDLNLYLKKNLSEEAECQVFLQELAYLQENFADIWNGTRILPFSEKLYILAPFRVKGEDGFMTAILGFAVEKDALEERFQFACGGYEGTLALYQNEELLYCSQKSADIREEKNTLLSTSADGVYSLYYAPAPTARIFSNQFWTQFFLILADIILIVVLAYIWAEKSYRPLRNMAEKYQSQLAQSDIQHENALKGIDYMMDSVIKSNRQAALQNQQQQKLLKNYYLEMLLQNNNSLEVLSCLDEMDVTLLASCWQVISISYARELSVTDDFLTMLVEELEQITNKDAQEYVYACYNYKKKLINVLCNYDSLERSAVLSDIVVSVAESFSYTPIVGMGNVYSTLSGLSASWLESLNAIHEQEHMEKDKQPGFVYESGYLQQIIGALEIGSEEIALEKLNLYVAYLEKTAFSFLMLQYIFADFMGEVTKLSRKHHLDLSVQSVSLMLASKNVHDFETAAIELIRDFCKKFALERSIQEDSRLFQIYEHISKCFSDYDISLEGVAEVFHVNTTTVRQAVLKYTGKTYKDYIIFLRIEYAKKLLQEESLTIAEICEKVGYANISYFIRLFREIVGVTPAKYRNKTG